MTTVDLIVVDPNFSLTSPTLRSFIMAIPFLESNGFNVKSWCSFSDSNLDRHVSLRLPLFDLPGPLNFWLFTLLTTLAHFFSAVTALFRPRKERIFLSGGAYDFLASFAIIQFSQADWLDRQRQLPLRSLREVYDFVTRWPSLLLEQIYQHFSRVRKFLIVSDGVAHDYRKAGVPEEKIKILPNAYDEGRFSSIVRAATRSPARQQLGLESHEIVFCFCSMGHLRRKGFHLAIEALFRLREQGLSQIRLVVIGGRPAQIAQAQEIARSHSFPDIDWIVFTGHTSKVEFFMSACDALIMPSYSEAFSLVEIEAAALGLRLYLTAHHGSEMILRDGVNGRLLSWNPREMADVLQEEIATGSIHVPTASLGRALTMPQYEAKLLSLLRDPSN